MTALNDGFGGYLVLTLAGFLAHEPWRWLGLVLGTRVPSESQYFIWVRAVATAIVAGLVMRIVLFPAGALADVALSVRLLAFAGGLVVFIALGRNLGAGVAASAVLLLIGQFAIGP